MAAAAPFRVRDLAGAWHDVELVPTTSEAGVEMAVAGVVGLALGSFGLANDRGSRSAFHAGLVGDWRVVRLFRVRDLAGVLHDVDLAPDASEAGAKEAIAAVVGLAPGTFGLTNDRGDGASIRGGLAGEWRVVWLLPGPPVRVGEGAAGVAGAAAGGGANLAAIAAGLARQEAAVASLAAGQARIEADVAMAVDAVARRKLSGAMSVNNAPGAGGGGNGGGDGSGGGGGGGAV